MRANGVTTRKLARAINVTEQSVSKWRNGRCLPDIENLFIFCRMFEVKMDDIVV
ncbi:MAG: helix-turn-helix transcriptional regulator [Lachnospiraceae bacterium]|nr:helix-turn-helix transcriptional regulator [Lachnospiraceae bacterium]